MKRGANHQARRVGAALLLAACVPHTDATSSATEVLETTQSDDTYSSLSSATGGDTQPTASTTENTTNPSTSTSEPTTGSTDPSTSTSTSTGSTDTLDTTDGDTSSGTTGQQIQSCKKVDILFFVDNTGSGFESSLGVAEMIPHLAKRVEDEFADWDYHMMVVRGDERWGSQTCEQRCEQGGDPCDIGLPPYPCEYDPDACDQTLGAGITFPAGAWASNVQCPMEGDQRYISTGQSDLAETLQCMTKVGWGYTYPGKHQIVRAVLDALSSPMNAPGACNEGFLRDDAYLILFVVSPLPDIYTAGTPADWTKELKSHKGGKFDKIYFVGLFESCDSDFGKWKYEPMMEWVESLYHHALGHTCEPDLKKFIDPALDYIQSDCQE